MTETQRTNARLSRSANLSALDLSFPLWVFDADQPAWPRKLAAIPPGSLPAKLTGWYVWPWEYGSDLRRIDDELPEGVTASAEKKKTGGIQDVLGRLRYDDGFEMEDFRVVYEAGDDGAREGVRDFSEWVFDDGGGRGEGYVAPRRIVRIERKWDGVPVWDRKTGVDVLTGSEAGPLVSYGMASLVHDDDGLIRATGVDVLDAGDKIRKAQFEFLNDEEATGPLFEVISLSERYLEIRRKNSEVIMN
ncbi:hypothetical protein SLS55_005419 [Diplodia seriata]|uniref:MJ1316 RNA cyclic group end recognition domain-containing protein n=1 Tax=Diplodia seriata TaxID=420778 RepID=A0ABR3CGB7_9PEZI